MNNEYVFGLTIHGPVITLTITLPPRTWWLNVSMSFLPWHSWWWTSVLSVDYGMIVLIQIVVIEIFPTVINVNVRQ